MSDREDRLLRLREALEDHSTEGITILAAEPSRFIFAIILSIVGFLLAALLWSFFGRADVIVSAPGQLAPDSEVRRFYAPIEGELVDVFIAEGQPVNAGDVLARLNARGAIQVAANALEADLQLAEARRESERFPARRQLLQRQVEALERQIEIARSQHQKRIAEGMAKLGEAQQAKLEEARGNLEKARRVLEVARGELARYQRLFNREGGGGVSKSQVEDKRSEVVVAQADFKLAEARLGELDFQLSSEYAQARADLEGSDQQLTELQIQKDKLIDQIQYEENRVLVALRSAQLEAEAASRVRFENIDEENFLRILAPVTGLITDLQYTQPGDKVQANTPLGGIAAADARPVMEIEISEADRAFLRIGLEVKMKFNAFAYQRYGFISGTLEYISPSTRVSDTIQLPVYKGRVALERDYFEVEQERIPLRYGMRGTAEVVVRQRRIIDLALDPFRKLKG
ncbi:MAG: HlyD family efflux transporter periplasmic adaptor subunit [Halioglobus sp.]|nr:HlyD family efflux transporter periplasmic adaptor subunit [Halioglobus sp.]